MFRRRPSNASSDLSEIDIQKETEKVYDLYALAVDEINYAEDSRGSPYYSGDRITAREAIDGCATAFMQLLQHTSNHNLRSELQSTLAPRLIQLQQKYDQLPQEIDACHYY
ncbi:hypothetical protein DFQ28_009921 [Apophysomyces sp. BC1034]|nr:hypothetical protein DFQ30_009530 [Apophysomyces sp. BC1015]KAG0177981.1 hypothetical protein DFQ29_004114 [Apophysomyces sp. BC1021]KAG0185114.1 hypothetical protein DFQ28_009921 [Apophysomyces sp. BC1034]